MGFQNDYRNDLSFIINKENKEKLTGEDELIIHKDFGIEIHFNTAVKNLEFFFDTDFDENMNLLISIDFSNFDSSLVTNTRNLFSGCEELISINFNNFNTSLIKNMSNMFLACTSLESLDLSSFNTSLVNNMNDMFYLCSSLKYLDLSNFNTSLVKEMSYMFYGCSSLEVIDISNFDMTNCVSFNYMFLSADNLEYINLYNFKYSNNDISLLLNGIDTLRFVCQKDDIITNNYIYNCCDFNLETKQCQSDSDIIPPNVTNETNETNIEITNTIASESNYSEYITNSKSSGCISIGIIIGIIAGGVVVLSIIIVIIIYC